MIWRESRRDGRWKLGAVAIAAGAAFLAKAAYESATGTTLFVDSSAAGFIPLASAHLIGGAVGAIVGLGGRSALARSFSEEALRHKKSVGGVSDPEAALRNTQLFVVVNGIGVGDASHK